MMKTKFYISILLIVLSSCSSLIKATFITSTVPPETRNENVNDSTQYEKVTVDSTLPELSIDKGGRTYTDIKELFKPIEKLELKRNRTFYYSVHYSGGGIMGPEIIESQGKYTLSTDYLVLNFNKSRALKKGKWSNWAEVDESMKFLYSSDQDTIWRMDKKDAYLLRKTNTRVE